MKPLKVVVSIFLVVALQVGMLVGVTFAVALAGSAACATSAEDLQGQPAKDYLAHFTFAEQQEKFKIVQSAYDAGMRREKPMPVRAIWLVIATGIQESNLTNLLDEVDHDSAGYLQQRPSQGWGTYQDVTDPYRATQTFFEHLEDKYTAEEILSLPLKELAIGVQNPSVAAYGRWNWDKTAAELLDMVVSPGVEESCNASPEGWQLPVDADSYCVTYGYGMRKDARSPTGEAMHGGVDMACNANEPIYAVADGTVVFAGENGGFGWQVRIDHGDGTITSYSHMVAWSIPSTVVKDARVTRGQTIGNVGTTGRSFGEHLHFEVSVDGERVDPEPFMRSKGIPIR